MVAAGAEVSSERIVVFALTEMCRLGPRPLPLPRYDGAAAEVGAAGVGVGLASVQVPLPVLDTLRVVPVAMADHAIDHVAGDVAGAGVAATEREGEHCRVLATAGDRLNTIEEPVAPLPMKEPSP
jgi:hypothetical protein